MLTQTELDFRMSLSDICGSDGCSCQDIQDNWGVCTNEEDVNHAYVMSQCPSTCKIVREECGGNFAFYCLSLCVAIR